MGFKDDKHKIEVYLDDEELEILKDMAERDKASMAETLRIAMVLDGCTRGNLKAIKYSASRIQQTLRKRLESMVKA